MKGLILAAGTSQRMQDLAASRNKVLLDLGGGKRILDNLLDQFEAVGIDQTYITVGFDAERVRHCSRGRATALYNPFFEHYGVLSSVWIARSELYATPFLLSVGDHYLEKSVLAEFVQDQPQTNVLVHVELKKCDDEDMKVFVAPNGELKSISKVWSRSAGKALGEFSGMIRFSAAGSRQFFDVLEDYAWSHKLDRETFLADVLTRCHKRDPLAFCLSSNHRRLDVDYPSDYTRACELYASRPRDDSAPAAPEDDDLESAQPLAYYTT
jgi:choline kinase